MKAIVLKQNLIEAINVVQKAVMAKAALPVLEGIYIEAEDNLKLIGNCYELGIEYTVEADIQEKGSIVINAKIFGEMIRRLPDAPILIETLEGNRIRIECLNSLFEVKGLSAENYPLPPQAENVEQITIKETALRDIIKQTIFAIGNDENRKILTGALFEVSNGEVHIVALDSFRMAVSNTVIKENNSFKVVIPGKNMNEILRIFEASEEPVVVSLSGSLIFFDFKRCRIVSKTLDGEFMNYKSYIPPQYETVIKVSTKELESSLERASLITSDDRRFPVRFSIGEDTMIISSAAEVGLSKEEIRIENSGNNLHVGFNPKYFIDALKVISDEYIKISFNSSVGPCVITAEEHDKYLYLIVPVRLKNA